jgi:hypothetical protein
MREVSRSSVHDRQHHAATASCLGLVWEPETLWDLLIRAFCSVRKGTAVSQGYDTFFRFDRRA